MNKTKHYHVLGGIHGCMPDVNDVYHTKQDAREGLKWWIQDGRDSGYKYSGNLKDGYFEELKSNMQQYPNNYFEITECFEEDCLRDGDIECW